MAEFRRFFRGIGNANRTHQQGVEDGPELIIVVMGSTGTGKSSLINAMTKKRSVNVSDSLDSETSDIKVTPWIFSRRRFKLVDTPGFDDTKLSDTAVLKKIADYLQSSFGRRVFVNGIIYLHRIIDPRMTGTAVKNLQLLQDLCGNEVKNVLLVTTFWDMVPKGLGEKREAELASNYWRPLLELGSRMHRYRHKSSGEELILDILSHQSNIIELQLQIELTQAERTLLDTMAGRRLQQGLNHQLEQLGMTLNQVQGEQEAIETRRNTRSDQTARVDAQRNRVLEEIAMIEKDLEMLRMPRYIAMQEIDQRVAEIVAEKGMDEMDAFWDLYGAFEDENDDATDSPRESLGMNRGQPASPGYKPPGYAEQQFGRRNTENYDQQHKSSVGPLSYESPQVEKGGIEGGGGYHGQPQMSAGYTTIGYGGQQMDSRYNPQANIGPQMGVQDHFGEYGDQQMNPGSNFTGPGQMQQGRRNDIDQYGNAGHNTGEYGNQYRRDSRY